MTSSPQALWVAYIGSNVVGLIFLLVSWKSPKAGQLLFALLFGWACWINWHTALLTPSVYLDYAEAAIQPYRQFINGVFSEHITAIVGTIATGQGLIALGMLGRGWTVRWAGVGAIVFLVAIAPLGLYAAFPFSVTVSIAAWLVYRRATTESALSSRNRQQEGN